MLELLAHLSVFRELLTCGPHRTPKSLPASSAKRDIGGCVCHQNPSQAPPGEPVTGGRRQGLHSKSQGCESRRAFSTGPGAFPKKDAVELWVVLLFTELRALRGQYTTRPQTDMWNGNYLSCLKITSLDPNSSTGWQCWVQDNLFFTVLFIQTASHPWVSHTFLQSP